MDRCNVFFSSNQQVFMNFDVFSSTSMSQKIKGQNSRCLKKGEQKSRTCVWNRIYIYRQICYLFYINLTQHISFIPQQLCLFIYIFCILIDFHNPPNSPFTVFKNPTNIKRGRLALADTMANKCLQPTLPIMSARWGLVDRWHHPVSDLCTLSSGLV